MAGIVEMLEVELRKLERDMEKTSEYAIYTLTKQAIEWMKSIEGRLMNLENASKPSKQAIEWMKSIEGRLMNLENASK